MLHKVRERIVEYTLVQGEINYSRNVFVDRSESTSPISETASSASTVRTYYSSAKQLALLAAHHASRTHTY